MKFWFALIVCTGGCLLNLLFSWKRAHQEPLRSLSFSWRWDAVIAWSLAAYYSLFVLNLT